MSHGACREWLEWIVRRWEFNNKETKIRRRAPNQCEVALNEIIRDSALRRGVLLQQSFEISKWLINGQPAAIRSRVHLDYGMKPCISTFLKFETVEQFVFVKKVLSDLDFCTLNEKHLKPVKRMKKRNGAKGTV